MNDEEGVVVGVPEEFSILFHVICGGYIEAVQWAERAEQVLRRYGFLKDEDDCHGHVITEDDLAGYVIINEDELVLASTDVYHSLSVAWERSDELEQETNKQHIVYALAPEELSPVGDLVQGALLDA